MDKKTSTIIVIVIIVVLALVAWAWYSHNPVKKAAAPATTQQQTTASTTGPVVQTTQVPDSQLPTGFPSDIPLEAGAQITQNYTAQASTGLSQATRVWVTAKTLDQEFQVYQTFFGDAKNGWTIQNTVNQTNLKAISAGKGKVQVMVNINQNTVTGQKTVNISATWPTAG